jgi:hypothetical protein
MSFFRPGAASIFICVLTLFTVGCGEISHPPAPHTEPLTSPETQTQVDKNVAKGISVQGKARIGLLYKQGAPAHRQALLDWLKDNGAEVKFEDETFAYLDAELGWAELKKLLATSGKVGLRDPSIVKLELESLTALSDAEKKAKKEKRRLATPEDFKNTSFTGPAHSAGYGAKVTEFREKVAKEFNLSINDLAGQDRTVAVFDGGIDLSRTDVFDTRIRDWVIGDEALWMTPTQTFDEFIKSEDLKEIPKEIEALKPIPSTRFFSIDELDLNADLNGSGQVRDRLIVVMYKRGDNKIEFRVRPGKSLPFGDPILSFAEGYASGTPQIVNFYDGKLYRRPAVNASPSAGAFVAREKDGKTQVALVGTFASASASHGIANLHMVGGNYTDGAGKVKYQGVAPAVKFLAPQTWILDDSQYGALWIPLARNIIQATKAGADVLDLDIATPGPRNGSGLLSTLLCRITSQTNTVPVVAAHNYGPTTQTVQSLAQSPCVLGIGAANSLARFRLAGGKGTADGTPAPELQKEDDVQTTYYSGRGFGLNGYLKPDIISPNYGYTAYGASFTRFGGTSGATPTTAGMIALLKQALGKKGVEVGLEQVRFLLQGSSIPVPSKWLLDGYGYTNLEEAWNLFKSLYDENSKTFAVSRLQISGNRLLHFDGKPTRRILNLSLKRENTINSEDTALPLEFSVTYGGQSDANSHWVKLFDESTENLTETLSLDVPKHGETQGLRIYVDLSDEAYAALPPGEHVAIVKGVRRALKDDQKRRVDFLLPVTFTKPDEIVETSYPIAPLFADQYQTFAVATQPGDVLLVNGEAKCDGQAFPGVGNGSPPESLWLMIDGEAFYPGAERVMNGYAPSQLGNSPIRIRAQKELVRLTAMRRAPLRCAGGVSGTLRVRRVSLQHHQKSTEVVEREGKFTVMGRSELTLKGSSEWINEWTEQTGNGRTLSIGATSGPRLIARRKVTGDLTLAVPKDTITIRVVPDSDSSYQALLVESAKDGSLVNESTSNTSYATGLDTLTLDFGGEQGGLELPGPLEGNQISYLSANPNVAATLVIELNWPGASQIQFVPTDAPRREAISQGLFYRGAWMAQFPSRLPESLAVLSPADYSFEIVAPFTVTETPAQGITGNTVYPSIPLGEGTFRAGVPFRPR